MGARIRTVLLGVAACAAAFAGPVPARAAVPITIYLDAASVGGRCSDARTAAQVTKARPVCTSAKALDLVPDGGTVLVRRGTYPKVTTARAFAQPTRFAAYPGEQPVLQGVELAAEARNLEVNGFRITDITELFGESLAVVDNDMSPSGVIMVGSHNRAEGNYVHDLRITFDANSTAPRCHSFWMVSSENDANHDGIMDYPLSETGGIAPRCGTAFRVQGADQVIRDNTVVKVPADGVQATNTTNLLVQGNHIENVGIQSTADGGDPLEHPDGTQLIGPNVDATFRDNLYLDTRGILVMANGEDTVWPAGVRIENNVFYSRKDTGAGIGCVHVSAANGVVIDANTCYGEGGYDPRLRVTGGNPSPTGLARTDGVVLRNNVIERYYTDGVAEVDEDYDLIRRFEPEHGIAPGPHTVRGTPIFADDDPLLPLAEGSPGIDAGTSDGTPSRDRAGRPRCDDPDVPDTGGGAETYYDIGASEFSPDTCVAYDYASVVRRSAPVGYWRLGDGSGTAAVDSTGGPSGVYRGLVALGQPGAVEGDTAVGFGPASSQVTVPASRARVTGDQVSVELWLRRARTGVAEGLVASGSYQVRLDAAGHVCLRKASAANVACSTTALTDTTAFHHVVVTKSGPVVGIYIDGVNVAGPVVNRILATTAGPVTLANGAGAFYGTLDEVAVYNRALSAAEVAAHFSAR